MAMQLHARMMTISVIANQVSVLAQALLVIATSDRAASPAPGSVCLAAAEACSLAGASIRRSADWCDLGSSAAVRELGHAAAVLQNSQIHTEQIRAATTALETLVDWMRLAAGALEQTVVQVSPDEWLSVGGEPCSQDTKDAIARLIALGDLIREHFGHSRPTLAQPQSSSDVVDAA